MCVVKVADLPLEESSTLQQHPQAEETWFCPLHNCMMCGALQENSLSLSALRPPLSLLSMLKTGKHTRRFLAYVSYTTLFNCTSLYTYSFTYMRIRQMTWVYTGSLSEPAPRVPLRYVPSARMIWVTARNCLNQGDQRNTNLMYGHFPLVFSLFHLIFALSLVCFAVHQLLHAGSQA